MKKSLLLIVAAGFLLVAGLFGYRVFHRAGSAGGEQPAETAVSKPATPAVSSAAQRAPDAAPRSAVTKNLSQPESAVQVVSAPGDRFQPLDEALILDRRGRLFVSYDAWSTYWFYRNDHFGRRRTMMFSPDGGDTWKLTTTADLE